MTTPSHRAQFELERNLRRWILDSRPKDRPAAIATAYDELFNTFPKHTAFQETRQSRQQFGRRCAGLIAPLVRPGARVLEVGCGRGDVLAALSEQGCHCTGTEPSHHMLELCRQYHGIDFSLGTAETLNFSTGLFDLVFSMQVIEHLHPDDVPRHLAEALRVLRPEGIVAIETPNRRTGPQDISRGFTETAQGLHLKEWSVSELAALMRQAGFRHLRGLLGLPVLARRWRRLHRLFRVPAWVKQAQDVFLSLVPSLEMRTCVAKLLGLDDIFLFGCKP